MQIHFSGTTESAHTSCLRLIQIACGSYKLLQPIGEGMGTVWMDEQQEPVSRRVALIVIRGILAQENPSRDSKPNAKRWR